MKGAYLLGAHLEGAYLLGAHLEGADFYFNSHDFALEIICKQDMEFFSDEEWVVIGKIATHKLCWDKIKTDFKSVISIFKKLADLGFDEYLKKFKGEI